MPVNFPSSPTTGQQYSFGSNTWTYNGQAWVIDRGYSTWKPACRVATSSNITLSGVQTIDNILLNVGDRVLVKNQSVPTQNGIYNVQVGSWIRANDFDSSVDITDGAITYIREGVSYAAQTWVLTTIAPILDTSNLTFSPIATAATSAVTDGDKGDISVTNTGTTWTIDPTGVTPGSYSNPSFVVNSKGQITSAFSNAVSGGNNPKSISMMFPASGDRVVLWYNRDQSQISTVFCIVQGTSTPSIPFTLYYGTNLTLTGTAIGSTITASNTTLGQTITLTSGNIVPANNMVWLTTGNSSGVVSMLHVTVVF